MAHSTGTPRIYVACLASYNAGVLHGEWCDATDEAEIEETIGRVIRTSPVSGAEEWAIHDHEGLDGLIGEYTSPGDIADWAVISECQGHGLIRALKEHLGTDDPREVETFWRNRRAGVADSWEDLAREMWEHREDIPQDVLAYIDFEAIGRDMRLNGDLFAVEVDGELHFFDNHG